MNSYDAHEIFRKAPDVSMKTAMEELAKIDPLIFAMYYRRLKGRPLTFDVSKEIGDPGLADLELYGDNLNPEDRDRKALLLRHRPFLMQILVDQHPHKVIQKSRQAGQTETAITEELQFLVANENTKWIRTFPRNKQLEDFSTTRLNEALNESPRMKSLFGIPNQVYTKRIGKNSFLFMRSAWESNLGEGVDADGVTFDEKDRMQDKIEVAFEESLSSSKFHFRRDISTPTLPGRGVNLTFEKSCQFEWYVKCRKCGLEQMIDHPDNIMQMKDIPLSTQELQEGTYAYRCRKDRCRGKLDRLHGRWIAKYPERSLIHGYHISQTICPWISATEIMQKLITYRFNQLWTNYVLGLTSVGENVLVGQEHFDAIMSGHEMIYARTPDWDRITVGVDWGHLNWVIVLGQNAHNGKKYILNIGIFEDSNDPFQVVRDVTTFIAPYEPDLIIPDAGYGKDRNSYLLKKFPKKVYAQWYNPSEERSRTFNPVWSDALQKVLVDRTMTLKNVCRALRDKEIGVPRYDEKVKILIAHFKALAPMREEVEGEIVEIIGHTGPDHLAHALASALTGFEKLERGGAFSVEFVG